MNKRENIKDINDSQVFIVEDNDMHSLMMDYMLSNETMAHIRKFKSGEECIENLSLKPDVVILDYGLPGINGMETLLAIKEYNPELPVIVITGSHDRHVAQKFLNAGVYDYIEKDDDGFEQVGKVTDNIINLLLRKKDKKRHKQNLVFIGVALILAALVFITYLLSRN